ncbi:hypothetical protein V6N13_016744 [Hibiscus sabdariffa]
MLAIPSSSEQTTSFTTLDSKRNKQLLLRPRLPPDFKRRTPLHYGLRQENHHIILLPWGVLNHEKYRFGCVALCRYRCVSSSTLSHELEKVGNNGESCELDHRHALTDDDTINMFLLDKTWF